MLVPFVGEIALVLRSSERLGYILTAQNTDHAKSPKDPYKIVNARVCCTRETNGKLIAQITREPGIFEADILS
jgi:hypothetical protein